MTCVCLGSGSYILGMEEHGCMCDSSVNSAAICEFSPLHKAELPTDLGIEEWLLFYGDLRLGR